MEQHVGMFDSQGYLQKTLDLGLATELLMIWVFPRNTKHTKQRFIT